MFRQKLSLIAGNTRLQHIAIPLHGNKTNILTVKLLIAMLKTTTLTTVIIMVMLMVVVILIIKVLISLYERTTQIKVSQLMERYS